MIVWQQTGLAFFVRSLVLRTFLFWEEKRRMEPTQKTIIDNLEDRGQKHLHITAFESLGGSSIDYCTFFEAVNIYARAFRELDVEDGDVVTLCTAGTLDTVLLFSALNRIGAVAQFVNPNYFRVNSKKYIDEAGSSLLVCLDRFYPMIRDAIAETKVKRILLVSLSAYASFLYKVLIPPTRIRRSDRIPGVSYMDLSAFVKSGMRSTARINRLLYTPQKPAVITYTSGTTGNPKGVVHTNDSINNMISIYALTGGFGNSAGDRNLVLIPPMYLTSFVHSIFAPCSYGSTNILQPIYDPSTLGRDIKRSRPKAVVASKAHYIQLANARLKKGSLNCVKYAYCGGEALSKATANKINATLAYYGIPPMVIGYGQTEFGTMTMFNSDIPTRTNESGIPIPTVHAKLLNPITGEPIGPGERGELYIQTPALMKEYFNDPEATARFIVTDEAGQLWGRTGDIAQVIYRYEGKDVYEVYGRKNDAFTDESGRPVYLFDIEAAAEEIPGVKEAEAIALTVDGRQVPIVHMVLEDDVSICEKEFVRRMDATLRHTLQTPAAVPYAYKIRASFSTSPISGKRDYSVLQFETEGYLRINHVGEVEQIELNSQESRMDNDLLRSRIRV